MDIPHIFRTKTSEETKALGRDFADLLIQDLYKGYVVCLYGELGSGKTTFTQGIAEGLNISERILSPTFIGIKEYHLKNKTVFNHVDLYRFETNNDINLSEILNHDRAITIIEWAEKMGDKKPYPRFDIYFSTNSDATHEIQVEEKQS